MDLKSKKALVFGGTSGIGLAIVRQLQSAGANVVAISREPSKAGDLGANVSLAQCDVRDTDALQTVLQKLAPYDMLISAATGGDRAVGPFLEMDLDGFKGSFDKLWGYANVVRYGAQYLPTNGCITLISGAPARRMRAGQVAISSVGGAVEALVRGLAMEISPRRINVVSPGLINTPMFPGTEAQRQQNLANATSANLIPRPGKPDEIAQAVMLTLSNEFMTGTTIDVDGGWLLS